MKKSKVISVTLMMLGMAYARALTATFSPLFLEISLKGLMTLKILMILKELGSGVREIIEITIMMKSSIFQAFLK